MTARHEPSRAIVLGESFAGAAASEPMTASLWPPLEALVRPLDALRRRLWSISAKTAFGRACLRDRALRLTTLAFSHMLVALTLTLVAPVWMLLLGPIVLGVPHVASDVRYLVLRPPLPLGRGAVWLVLGPLVAMTAARAVAALGGPYLAPLEILCGAAAMMGGVLIAPAPWRRKAVAFTIVIALALLGLAYAQGSLVLIAHLHNLVAFGLWLWFFRAETSKRLIAAVGLTYVAVGALFMSGAVDGVLLGHATGSDIGGFGMLAMSDTLAPGLEPLVGLRLVAFYAFAQSMHYVVWLRLIPQGLDARTAPPTLKRSVVRLRSDFGRVGFAALVAATLVMPIAALVGDAEEVRTMYLLAVIAHGWLELAIIAALCTRARGRASA